MDLRDWAVGLMEKDNRKSHLAPQLSPATKELLRSTDSPTFLQGPDGLLQTPTSGEIPIGGAGIVSPRDIYDRNGLSYARTPNTAVHPPSAGVGTFSLPVRPAPGGPLPQVPVRNGTPEESRRQARFGMPPNGGYPQGYPSN